MRRDWQTYQGRKGKEPVDTKPCPPVPRDIKAERKKPASPILDKIEQSKARHRLHLQSQIMALGKHSWQACAWLLERKYPSMFGRKDAQLANELRHSGFNAINRTAPGQINLPANYHFYE